MSERGSPPIPLEPAELPALAPTLLPTELAHTQRGGCEKESLTKFELCIIIAQVYLPTAPPTAAPAVCATASVVSIVIPPTETIVGAKVGAKVGYVF